MRQGVSRRGRLCVWKTAGGVLGWGKLCLVQDRLCLWQTGGAGAGQAMLCVRQGVAGATMCSLPFLASLTSPFSPCRFPTHLIAPLVKSFKHDHYVDDTGNVLYYKEDPNFSNAKGEFRFFFCSFYMMLLYWQKGVKAQSSLPRCFSGQFA